jgi:hypothetical protein
MRRHGGSLLQLYDVEVVLACGFPFYFCGWLLLRSQSCTRVHEKGLTELWTALGDECAFTGFLNSRLFVRQGMQIRP